MSEDLDALRRHSEALAYTTAEAFRLLALPMPEGVVRALAAAEAAAAGGDAGALRGAISGVERAAWGVLCDAFEGQPRRARPACAACAGSGVCRACGGRGCAACSASGDCDDCEGEGRA